MKANTMILGVALAGLALQAQATDWTPTGEFGLVATSGNSDTLNVNGKIALHGEDELWLHDYHALALRSESEDVETANRYELAGRTGYRFNETSYAFGALRYENDDFSPYESQTVVSVGYGVFAIKSEPTTWLFEIGPGYRFADLATGTSADEFVVRGLMDFKHAFTPSTTFYDTLVVEAGSDNSFIQGDVGVQVAMSSSFALKAGVQARHNTDVPPGVDKTDTVVLVNLVWSAPK